MAKLMMPQNYLDGFHCDHTRQVTPMHKSGSKSNDLNKFVLELQAPGG